MSQSPARTTASATASTATSVADSPTGYSQTGRSMRVFTALPSNVLLLLGLAGAEAISRLFEITLDLAAPDPTQVDFVKLLGAPVRVELDLPEGGVRSLYGICSSLSEGMRRGDFTLYDMRIVPPLWRLTQQVRNRIFQHQTIPEILAAVLAPIPNVQFQLAASYHPREYCVQYRESDFHFASRLMEEEGIYYYFVHAVDRVTTVVGDDQSFPPLTPPTAVLEQVQTPLQGTSRITTWSKTQRIAPARVLLGDHTFELPHDALTSPAPIQPTVKAGKVVHDLAAGGQDLAVVDWPGAFARRYDSVDRHGNPADPSRLAGVPAAGLRTAQLRAQELASSALAVAGSSTCRQFTSGHAVSVHEQPVIPYKGQSLLDGVYILISVEHLCQPALDYKSGEPVEGFYGNTFTAIPQGLPFRPPRTTARPVLNGVQTAIVAAGPGGDEIFTDPFGRVKVHFHWDPAPASPDCSCWIRVAHQHAGTAFGMVHVPRAGQEVVVQFEEGSPDRPLIVGAVYNPQTTTPFPLPAQKMVSGFRSNTYPGGGGNNEISMDDTKGNELVYIHAQHNKTMVVNNDRAETVGNNVAESVGNDKTVAIANNVSKQVGGAKNEHVGGSKTVVVQQNHYETINVNQTVTVHNDQTIKVGGSQKTSIDASQIVGIVKDGIEIVNGLKDLFHGNHNHKVAGASSTAVAGTYGVSAGQTLTLTCGLASLKLSNDGTIAIDGSKITLTATGDVEINGKMIYLN